MPRPDFLHGSFTLTYEVNPPRGADADAVLAHARAIAPYVDAVNVTDCPLSNLRMNPGPLAARIQRDLEVSAIPHVTARDRNLLALQSELLGLSYDGIRHVFCLTGDPIHIGDHPHAKPVFELFANELIALVARLNDGRDHTGRPLTSPTRLCPGAAVTLTDPRPEARDAFQKKVDAGAGFFQTQVVLDPASLDNPTARAFQTDVPLLVGTVPLRGPKALERLRAVPGVDVTPRVEARLKNAPDFAAEAKRLVLELRDAVKGRYAGLHLMPVVPDEPQILDLLRELRNRKPLLHAPGATQP